MEARKQPNVFIQTHICWEAPRLQHIPFQQGVHLQKLPQWKGGQSRAAQSGPKKKKRGDYTDYLDKRCDYFVQVCTLNTLSLCHFSLRCFSEQQKLEDRVVRLLIHLIKSCIFLYNIIPNLLLFVVAWNRTKLSPDDRWSSTFRNLCVLQDFPPKHQADPFFSHFARFSIFQQIGFYVRFLCCCFS